jgi:hypothetical protein
MRKPENTMQEIKLSLTIEEANLVLEGLGNLPFARVYQLVAKVQEQAARQLEPTASSAPALSAASGAPVTPLRESHG